MRLRSILFSCVFLSLANGHAQMIPFAFLRPICEMNNSWTPQWASVVGYWKLNGSGSIANNATVTASVGANGTAKNATASYTTGVIGPGTPSGVNFGAGSYITMANPTALNGSGLGQATIMAWLKPNLPAATAQTVMGKELSYKLQIEDKTGDPDYPSGGYNATMYISTNGSSWACIAPSVPAITAGQWVHITATWSTSTPVKVYVNGALQASWMSNCTPSSAPNNAAYNFQLSGWGGGNELYTGLMDEAVVFNKELTATEIDQIYKRQKTCNY